MTPGIITAIGVCVGLVFAMLFKRFAEWEANRELSRLRCQCDQWCSVNTEKFGPVLLKTTYTSKEIFIEASVMCIHNGSHLTLTAHLVTYKTDLAGWKESVELRNQDSEEYLCYILNGDDQFISFWNAAVINES
jgi:hypothetical protein